MDAGLKKAFRILTVCTVLYTPHLANAQSRCTADLQRVNPLNCLNRDNRSQSYQWSLTDQTFNIEVKSCISDPSANGTHKDVVIAIDRSASNLVPDKLRKKLRADSISVATDLIELLASTYQATPEKAPNVAVAFFAGDASCREYSGGPISFTGEFPCLYTKALKVSDPALKSQLTSFLSAAEGKYSAGSAANASDISIVAGLVRDRLVIAPEGRQNAIAMFTTGLSYNGVAGDVYAFLKSPNYELAQTKALENFSHENVRKSKMIVMTAPLNTPYYGSEYRDSFENMCALPDRPANDCAAKSTAPATWMVNTLNINQRLTAVASLSSGIVRESNASAVAAELAGLLLVQGTANIIPEQVNLRINDQASNAVAVSGEKITVHGISAGENVNVAMDLIANGETVPFTFSISTNIVEGADKDFTDREMFCAAGESPSVDKITLKDLQGGSGSCGVIAGENRGVLPYFVMMALPLLLVLVKIVRVRRIAAVVFAALFGASGQGMAEEKVAGLNSQHYRPVVDGVANTESAKVINSGTFNVGIYGDYANDPVEIGGEKGRRVKGVTDDMVTAHFTGNVGLFPGFALGMHVPYVHKTDIDREVEGEKVDGGSLGQPADSAVFAKIGLLNRSRWALALIPQYTIATGSSEHLIGDGTSNYGASFAVSGISGALSWATNLGYMHRSEALSLSDDRTNELKVTGYGLLSTGMQYRINGLVSAGGNISGKFHSGERIDFTRSNPAEWQANTKLKLASTFEGSLGVGTGIGKGYGAPDYRVVAGFTYVPSVSRGTVRRVAGSASKK